MFVLLSMRQWLPVFQSIMVHYGTLQVELLLLFILLISKCLAGVDRAKVTATEE